MSFNRLFITLALALGISAGTGTVIAQKGDLTIPAGIGDLNAVQLVEVRDQSGKVLLNGTLKTESSKPKEIEREAELTSPNGDKAEGELEIELERKTKNGTTETKDEIELEVEHLPANLQCELFLDGKRVGSFTTSKKGKAEFELERKSAGW
jgi:ribosomal protein S13